MIVQTIIKMSFQQENTFRPYRLKHMAAFGDTRETPRHAPAYYRPYLLSEQQQQNSPSFRKSYSPRQQITNASPKQYNRIAQTEYNRIKQPEYSRISQSYPISASPHRLQATSPYRLQLQSSQRMRKTQLVFQTIWQHLYREGMRSKQQIRDRHESRKGKIDGQCTFQPTLQQSKRFLAENHSTFLERINIWQEHRIERLIKEKEQDVSNQLKECTFTPKLNPNRKNRNSPPKNILEPSRKVNVNRQINPYYPTKQLKNQCKDEIHTTPSKNANKSRVKGEKGGQEAVADCLVGKSTLKLSKMKNLIRKELRKIPL